MLQLYSTMTRRKEQFTPLEPGVVRMYSCGPTVYDFPHIGNLRTFVLSDLLARCLRRRGLEVRNVMNITDVDDKTIAGARREGVTLQEYTARYTQYFFEDLQALRIQPAWRYPRATENIPQMQQIIATLLEKGHAYVHQGSVYFDISSYPGYGRLSGAVPSAETGRDFSRIDADEYNLEDVRDFALWKAAEADDPPEAVWDSPWGPGRPGWHIECTAMSRRFLGDTLDIHVGGVDLIFPHHENEVAQSEAATGTEFVRYWVHGEHLIVEGEKMSKSKGNFYTLRDLQARGFEPVAVRHLLMTAHYRHQLNFTLEGLNQSQQALGRLWDFVDRLEEIPAQVPGEDLGARVQAALANFNAALDDDLNIPQALAVVFELMREVNPLLAQGRVGGNAAAEVLTFLCDVDQVLGIIEHEKGSLDAEIEALIAERQQARAAGDYARADQIRNQLLAQGIVIEDTPQGPRWRRQHGTGSG